MEVIVGTAGHIDHGKTALVKALTGVDADRLPEEKRRGITIDLGFAELDLGDIRIGFVDVPGHEKFVKNMLAGAHGIDLVALVIAADEGVMPQTREHFDICRLLGVKAGLVVLTKTDLVDDEMLELVRSEAAELVKNSFLANAPVIPVSARTGQGIPELKESLRALILKLPSRSNDTITRLPIDRIFSVKGFGTVVTGTLVAGKIQTDDELEILPLRENVRVRNLQVHGRDVSVARAGNRTAVNLGGIKASQIERGQIERGMMLAPAGSLLPTQSIDVALEVLPDAARPLRSRQRVRVHLGTSEVLGRLRVIGEMNEISPGETGFAQLRLESPVAAVCGERFVVRSYSPQITIAGGAVLDNSAARHRRRDFANIEDRLRKMSASIKEADKAGLLKLFLRASDEYGLRMSALGARLGWRIEVLQKALADVISEGSVIDADGVFLAREHFDTLAAKTLAAIEKYHAEEPLARGLSRETLREKLFSHLPAEVFHKTLRDLEQRDDIVGDKDIVRMMSHNLNLSSPDESVRQKLLEIYRLSGLEVPTLHESLDKAAAENSVSKDQARRILQVLLDSGDLVRVTPEMLFSKDEMIDLIAKIRSFAAQTPGRLIDIGIFKEIAGISRKYAIPLLEYLDREKITRRAGDKRLVL